MKKAYEQSLRSTTTTTTTSTTTTPRPITKATTLPRIPYTLGQITAISATEAPLQTRETTIPEYVPPPAPIITTISTTTTTTTTTMATTTIPPSKCLLITIILNGLLAVSTPSQLNTCLDNRKHPPHFEHTKFQQCY